jgi:NADPH:quinone reductase
MKSIELFFNDQTKTQDFRVIDSKEMELKEHDIRVAVKAISVNPVDYKIASTIKTAHDAPRVLGWDASGVVIEVGSAVTSYKKGDEVYYAGDISRAGTNSETQLVDERIVGRKPQTLSFKEAAALPLTTITAWEAIFDQLRVDKKEKKSILILNATGGVGSIAVQLLKQLTGLTVIGTASRAASEQWIRDLGVDYVVNHNQDISLQLQEIGHPEVDYILCFSDTDGYFDYFPQWAKPFGRITSIVETTKPVNLGMLKSKSLSFSWEFMFARSLYQTSDMIVQQKLLNELSMMIDAGNIKTSLALDLGEMSPDNLRKAHELLRTGKMIGKIVMGSLIS